ncbi:hydroxyacylglutathione hydrolase [Brackiella oedipodis]|uniref:hydroxyacylglutathione hydrolase n=1 Tax=Brackiella oedipodis TaxID=124225 RepID=UPI00048FAFC2|nr:hydroxyacylglutathione hydrolase [Brackiella oedipodis]
MTNYKVFPLPAFSDNYIWIIQQADKIIVVDPGQAEPVLNLIQEQYLQLQAILITHHHADHTGGLSALLQAFSVPVFGPRHEAIQGVDHLLEEGDRFELMLGDLRISVLDVPAHTAGHIAYFAQPQGQDPWLFCGDTLFASGCGRLFEGDSRQMLQSLEKFKNLPQNTKVFCAHEYTLSNIKWALAVEPHNAALQAWSTRAQALRDQGQATIPTTIQHELQCNPFMRTEQPAVIRSASDYAQQDLQEPVQVLATLREWKNNF